MTELEAELKRLIIDTLMLEDITPEQIDRDAPLFVDGLGLDSIDALELALAISRKYGVRIKADDERNREVFQSLKSLAAFIQAESAQDAKAG
ncbi:MAG TPA: phosphopantetheine-binding protein [Polyangia bacterium]|jgi:acyl carrier protein|nr:phosphopantetheine-binding protein [Polyangia bacterium]